MFLKSFKFNSLIIIILFLIIEIGATQIQTIVHYDSNFSPMALDWNGSSLTLAIGYDNGTVFIFDVKNNNSITLSSSYTIYSLKWNNRGDILAIGSDNGIDLWNRSSNEYIVRNYHSFQYQRIFSLDWSNDSTFVLGGSRPGANSSLIYWNIENNSKFSFSSNKDWIWGLDINPDMSEIALATNSSIIIKRIGNFGDNTTSKSLYETNSTYYIDEPDAVYWMSNGNLLSLLKNGNVTIWNPISGTIIDSFEIGVIDSLYGSDFDIETNTLAVTYGYKAKIYNVENHSLDKLVTNDYHIETTNCLSINNEKGLLALGSFDQSVSIWNLTSGILLDVIGFKVKHTIIQDSDSSSTSVPGFSLYWICLTLFIFRKTKRSK